MSEGVINLLSAFLGAIAGGALTYITEIRLRKEDRKQQERHYASMLYYDLRSIENYVLKEESSVDIRYSSDWQSIVSECTFLKPSYVENLYKIYDLVYNFNYHFKEQKKVGEDKLKTDIKEFMKLVSIFMHNSDATYKDVMRELSSKL
jgi:hypothetical protein